MSGDRQNTGRSLSQSFGLNRSLSPILEPYRDRIAATIKPYLGLTLVPDRSLTWWSNKFAGVDKSQAGLPYLPKEVEYPKTPQGQYLHLLAQINFAESPSLPGFPDRGILQFYVADGELWGCPYPNYTEEYQRTWYEQNTFRIRYFPEIDFEQAHLVTDFDFLPNKGVENLDHYPQSCSAIQWFCGEAPMPSYDYQFYNTMFGNLDRRDRSVANRFINEFLEAYYREIDEEMPDVPIQMGGYTSFAQEDPRDGLNLEEVAEPLSTLLLKISMPENVLLFYIEHSALVKRDFSRVMYAFS